MSRTMFGPSLVQQGSSLALPGLLLAANSFAGPESMMNYPSGLLSRSQQQDLTSRFMADRMPVPPGLSPFGLRPELHHHQHLHQHMHQHLMPPHSHPSGSSSSIDSAAAAASVVNAGTAFGSSSAASSLLLGMAGYSTLGVGSSSLSGLPGPRHGSSSLPLPSSLALPLIGGPFGLPLTSGLSGAFQPKNDGNPSLLMSSVQDRLSKAHQPRTKKSGQWCTAHVRIAWEIHLHQQNNEKKQQSDGQRNATNNKSNESNRYNDHLGLLHLPTGEGTMPGHLESLYRLGLPMFGRSPYSSARNPLTHLPFGGLGDGLHRLTGQPGDVTGGFIGAASDWLRLSKSTPFPCPPPLWLRVPPPEATDRERDKAEKEDEASRGRVSASAQETIENNRDSVSRRSSGSTRNERTRSRSPLRRPGRKASSSRDSASSPPPPPGTTTASSAQRSLSDRSSESRETDSRRHRSRHTASTSPAGTTTTTPTPPFPAGQIYPYSEPGMFLPYLWTNPLEGGDQLMRRLLGSVDDPLLRADRLAHLDLMLGKTFSAPLPPGGLGLHHFRHLPNPGRMGKSSLTAASLMPSRFPMGELGTSPIYKVLGDGHHGGGEFM